MATSFSSILVPVDFSINTDVAIQKAMWLAGPADAEIHLLHIMGLTSQPGAFLMHGISVTSQSTPGYFQQKTQSKLNDIKRTIQKSLPNVSVSTHITTGDIVQKYIIRHAGKIQPDLIIIGKSKNHDWFPFFKIVNASSISTHTNCPVLTVKPGGLPNAMKSVVIPVSTFVPTRKIELLRSLTRNHRPRVHLVAIEKEGNQNNRSSVFLETYRTLADRYHYPVEYEIIKGKSTGKAILQFAKSVMADMVIVDPNEQSKINGISGVQINDLILPTSKMSVLTVEPYHFNDVIVSGKSMHETSV
ncbi:MAG TPA: universal stress protein [Chitinophagaceae bacterium]|nr:universal stress protein [Chitinophagaceae bacterium]